jgi:hypothetical protein
MISAAVLVAVAMNKLKFAGCRHRHGHEHGAPAACRRQRAQFLSSSPRSSDTPRHWDRIDLDSLTLVHPRITDASGTCTAVSSSARFGLASLHRGGTRVLGILVAMDAKQRRRNDDGKAVASIPIHGDNEDVFKSPQIRIFARPSEKPASNTAFVTGPGKHLFAKAQGMLQTESLAWLAVPSANEKSHAVSHSWDMRKISRGRRRGGRRSAASGRRRAQRAEVSVRCWPLYC